MNSIKKVSKDMNEDLLEDHLERYAAKALELGASRCAIVDAASIPVDDTVTLKCQIPRCFGYGACAHCPPNTLKPSELKEHLKKYRRAVLLGLDVEPEVVTRNKATIKERIGAYLKMFKMISTLESTAFYDGHYLAFGFAAGSCRHSFCSREADCAALKGDKCRFALTARPSMEAVGIDVFRMFADVGWDIYPIGSGADAQTVNKGSLAGILIVQ